MWYCQPKTTTTQKCKMLSFLPALIGAIGLFCFGLFILVISGLSKTYLHQTQKRYPSI